MEQNGHFIWTNSNPFHPRILCAMFRWNWPSGSEEEEFFKFSNIILQRVYDNNDDDDADNDDDGQRTNFDQKRSLEPSAQVS